MSKFRFRSKRTVRPPGVRVGDAFAVKVVAVALPDNEWVAYEGPPHWSDISVALGGDKLRSEQAVPLFHVMGARRYWAQEEVADNGSEQIPF